MEGGRREDEKRGKKKQDKENSKKQEKFATFCQQRLITCIKLGYRMLSPMTSDSISGIEHLWTGGGRKAKLLGCQCE